MQVRSRARRAGGSGFSPSSCRLKVPAKALLPSRKSSKLLECARAATARAAAAWATAGGAAAGAAASGAVCSMMCCVIFACRWSTVCCAASRPGLLQPASLEWCQQYGGGRQLAAGGTQAVLQAPFLRFQSDHSQFLRARPDAARAQFCRQVNVAAVRAVHLQGIASRVWNPHQDSTRLETLRSLPLTGLPAPAAGSRQIGTQWLQHSAAPRPSPGHAPLWLGHPCAPSAAPG